jgi:hypothetical protein
MGRDLGVLARKIQSTSLLTDTQHKKIIYQSTGERQVGISRSPFATPTSGNASFVKHGDVQKVGSTNQFQHLKIGLEFSKFDSKSNKQQSIKNGREFLEKLETLVSIGVDLKVKRESPLKSNRVLNLRKTSFILFFVQLQVPLTYTLHFGKNHILPIKPFSHKKVFSAKWVDYVPNTYTQLKGNRYFARQTSCLAHQLTLTLLFGYQAT